MLSPSRVARLHTANDLSEVLADLDALRELSSNLSSLEQSFDQHYPGMLRVAAVIDPEIVSQGESLMKAINGLKAATEIKERIALILKAYPEDKTAARAMTDAETMISRFEKHTDNARKVIRTIAKKQMPPTLKAYAAKVEKIVTPRFFKEEDLKIIPWVSAGRGYIVGKDRWDKGGFVDCLVYSYVFRVDGLPPHARESDMDPNDARYTQPRRVQLTVSESTAGPGGTKIDSNDLGSYTTDDLKQGPEWFADKLLEKLRGWSGLQGEGAASKARKAVADQIANALSDVARRVGHGGVEKSVDPTGLSVDIHFRTDIRSEDYGEYDGSWQEAGNKEYGVPAEKAIAPFKDKIKKFSLWGEGILDLLCFLEVIGPDRTETG